jgi:hypothetical protein
MDDVLRHFVPDVREEIPFDQLSTMFGDLAQIVSDEIERREEAEAIEEEGEISSLDDILLNDPVFRSFLFLELPVSVPRDKSLTNDEGVQVDPQSIIERIEGSIASISSETFSRISIPRAIKRNLFEQAPVPSIRARETAPDGSVRDVLLKRGLQDPEFSDPDSGFQIDWNDDLGTADRILHWAEDELSRFTEETSRTDSRAYEMYVSYLVMSYLFHRNRYAEMGVDSLEKFWTEYSMERRQGTDHRPARATDWTIRETIVGEPERRPGEEPEGGPIPAVIGPVFRPRRELREREARRAKIASLTAYTKAAIWKLAEFSNARIEWQANPSASEDDKGIGVTQLVAMKNGAFERKLTADTELRKVGAILKGDVYSDDRDLEGLVKWHKSLRAKIAKELYNGMTTLERGMPLVSPERTRDAELREVERRFIDGGSDVSSQ